jgi:hypothetical protein
VLDKPTIITRMVSAKDITMALMSTVPIETGILPENALWWGQGSNGVCVALWRMPQVWKVALQTEPFKPPRRLALPMPGLIFICQPGRPPRVFAAKKRLGQSFRGTSTYYLRDNTRLLFPFTLQPTEFYLLTVMIPVLLVYALYKGF